MADYKLFQPDKTKAVAHVFYTGVTPKLLIPFDEYNTDYQDYLAWVAAGNTADAAD